MDDRGSSAVKWLAANNSVVRWRLIGPNISNPFDSQAADGRLEEYANDRSVLMDVCSIQALMDDTVLIKVSDLITFQFETEHPNLVGLTSDDLKHFLEQSGVWESLTADFNKLQQSCQDELDRRKG